MTLCSQEDYRHDAGNLLLESHILCNVKDSVVRGGTIVLLSRGGGSDRTQVQTAFEGAQNLEIRGGFFGIDSPDEAVKYSNRLLHSQLNEDRAKATKEMEMLALESDRLEAEFVKLESARESLYISGSHAQFKALNAVLSEEGYSLMPTGHDFRLQSEPLSISDLPSATKHFEINNVHVAGHPLRSYSDGQALFATKAQPAHHLPSRRQTYSGLRYGIAPMDLDTTDPNTMSRPYPKTGTPEVFALHSTDSDAG